MYKNVKGISDLRCAGSASKASFMIHENEGTS
jgi:hypothetical protein